MGQTASQIDESNPRPAAFDYESAKRKIKTYDDADKGNLDVDRVNAAQLERLESESVADSDSDSDNASSSSSSTSGKRRPSKGRGKNKRNVTVRRVELHESFDRDDFVASPKLIKKAEKKDADDDAIDDEQANQDLIAYLGIVGAHATNLPLSWRDDPYLGRTVSTLTSTEYATKANVFIPCDIRVIGASSDVQPRNTGLPPHEGVRISAMAVEPARTDGGAVANSLLKTLYDHENDDVQVGEDEKFDDCAVADNLFDDDDDASNYGDDESFASFEFGKTITGATLSWSDLIRKMKDEMANQGHGKVPILTTSRKFDLSEPVHLLPVDFDPRENRKFALLVGCNYKKSSGEIFNSHNDIKIMKDYIVNVHGFPEHNDYMTVLLDDGKHSRPSMNNITKALTQIARRSRPGDAVFIQFCGHGGRVIDTSADTDCFDEMFVPSDFQTRGLFSEKILFRTLVARLAEDVTVTMLLDSCDSGFVFDMPYAWETLDDSGETKAALTLNNNFSFVRSLNIVKMMYDTTFTTGDDNEDSDSSDDEEYYGTRNISKTPMISTLGQTLKNLQMEAEVEVHALKTKAKKVVKEVLEAAVEATADREDEYDSDEDRHERSFEARSDSFDDGSSGSSSDDSDSYDSYEERIARRRHRR